MLTMSKAPALSFLDHLNNSSRSNDTMPAFFPQSRQLPLTPPEYYEQYTYPGKQQQAVHQYDQYQQYANSYYMSDPYFPRSELERRARYEEAMIQQMKSNYASAPHRENPYGPVAAPILPPLRGSEQNQQRQVAQNSYKKEEPAQNKQEKSAGGVAAELDYDMEMMVDFVSQMTTGMWAPFVARHDLSDADFVGCIQPGAISVEKKFRKYVQSVLTSTRLPSATLLLALHYLSDRIKRRSGRGDFPHRNSNNLYHHLTVALMLASKFLDDNTFQNRSWAEVSQLPVHELNAREMDWLHDIRWQLHVDWEDSTGVRAWFMKWEEYTTLRLAPAGNLGLDQLKLNPIDVNLRNMMPSAPISPPTRDLPSFDNLQSQYEHVRLPAPEIQWPQIRSLSPPSAGPTHANTPEYYGSANATPCYLPSQHQPAQYSQQRDCQARNPAMSRDGQLLYTRQSPIYGPGYVCETRQHGSYTYDTHSFVGLDYTAQYASQLELGWCELHRRYKCLPCGGGTQAMYSQAAVA